MNKRIWRWVPLFLFVLLALFLLRGLSLDPSHLPSTKLGQSMGTFRLSTLQDRSRDLTEQDFLHHITILNVWASWCEACKEEHAFLMRLKREGILVYGLNYKDKRQDALRWLKDYGNPYQKVGSDKLGIVAMDLGVYGAPETFLLDSKGIIQYRHVGHLTPSVWQNEFLPRMEHLG